MGFFSLERSGKTFQWLSRTVSLLKMLPTVNMDGHEGGDVPTGILKTLSLSADHLSVGTKGFLRCLLPVSLIVPDDFHPLIGNLTDIKESEGSRVSVNSFSTAFLRSPMASSSCPAYVGEDPHTLVP